MNKKYKRNCLFFYLLTLIFVFIAIGSILDGIRDIQNLNPVQDIIKINITIISGILAIFFTLSAIVIQNILQKYSSSYLKVIFDRVIFKVLLLLLPISIIFNLLLLYYGSNNNLERFSLFLAIYIIISVAFAIVQLIYFLSISNIVSFISTQAFNHINKIFDPGTTKIEETKKCLPFLLRIKIFLYKSIFKKSFISLVKSLLNDVSVPQKNIEILGNDVRPIFSTCHKALNDDDREVVLSCLDNLKNIIISYLDKRKNYRGMEDNFLLFLNGQFEITLKIALRSYNQQYLEDIVKRVNLIALKCVELTDTQIRIGENGLVFIWIEFLKESIWKTMHLKYTSAPILAIRGIYQVGIGLVKKDAFITSIYSIGDALEKIGTNISSIPSPFHAVLTQNCIYGLLVMLKGFLEKIMDEGKIFTGMEVKSICNKIINIMDNVFNSKLSYMSYSTIQAPLVGSLWRDEKISSVISDVLFKDCNDKNKEHVFEGISSIIECFSEISRKAIVKNKGQLYEYSRCFSEIVYYLSIYLSNFNDNIETTDQLVLRTREKLSNLMYKLLGNITDIYKVYLSIESNINLFHLSPTFAFLTYFADKKKSSTLLLEIRDLYISRLLIIYTDFKPKDRKDERNKRNLYRYIKLFGAWINRSKNNSIKKEIIRTLADGYIEIREKSHSSIVSPLQTLGYPGGIILEEWNIYPNEFWVNDQGEITNELNDKSNNYLNYYMFDKKIKKYFNLFVKKKKN